MSCTTAAWSCAAPRTLSRRCDRWRRWDPAGKAARFLAPAILGNLARPPKTVKLGHHSDALSELWDPVALFPSPAGNFAMQREAFRDHCVTLFDFYRKQGVVRPAGALLSASELFPNVAQARMAYRMYGEREHLLAEWEHVYILRRGDRWRVSLSIADGEMQAWAARGVDVTGMMND